VSVFINDTTNKGGGPWIKKREEKEVVAAPGMNQRHLRTEERESMRDVISINSKRLFANYYVGRSRKQIIVEQALFWAGVLTTVVTPELFWSFSRGVFGFVTFGIVAVTGTGFGLARYYRFPFRVTRCVSKAVPQTAETTEKWAA
jgi:hypothetical protein